MLSKRPKIDSLCSFCVNKTGSFYSNAEQNERTFYNNETGVYNPEATFLNTSSPNSAVGIPLHFLYNSSKRFGLNTEIGATYYYPFDSNNEQAKLNLQSNYIFTADALLGVSYRLSSALSFDTGIFTKYDIINFTNTKNTNNLLSGLQFGVNYKLSK